MTDPRTQRPAENLGTGALLALLALPVGVVVFVLVSSIGLFASIVSFGIAFAALWLYRRGSGGRISRNGAWVVTAIVVVTILIGIWASLVVIGIGGLGHLSLLQSPHFWPVYNQYFGEVVSQNVLFIVLALAFGALGAFRLLRRAFATAPASTSTSATVAPTAPEGTVTPTTYRNDVDGAPTGSADDKTPPPTAGS